MIIGAYCGGVKQKQQSLCLHGTITPHGSQRKSVCINEPGGCARLASAMGKTANAQHSAGMAITQLMPRAGMRRPMAAGTIIEVTLVLMIKILLTGPIACTKRREVIAIMLGSSGP